MKKATAAAPPTTIAPATLFAKAAPVNWAAVAVLPRVPVPLANPPVAVAEAVRVGVVLVTE
jgi:hypothetical protein